jgi:hypothetical protein
MLATTVPPGVMTVPPGVMADLVPATHNFNSLISRKSWIAGTAHCLTARFLFGVVLPYDLRHGPIKPQPMVVRMRPRLISPFH